MNSMFKMLHSRAFTPIAILVAAVLMVGLYKTKTEAHAARERIERMTLANEASRAELKALRAETQYLESPARVDALSRHLLNMSPPEPPDPNAGERAP